MEKQYCKHCSKLLDKDEKSHTCSTTGITYDREENGDEFLTSMVIGMATNNGLLGGLLGGSLLGGIIGDALNSDD